jgi:signal transduction histidine kinase
VRTATAGEHPTRARLRRVLHRLQSIRLRVAISAAVVTAFTLFGGVAWLRRTVYDQRLMIAENAAADCARTLRIRLLRLNSGGGVEYYAQPLMECQMISNSEGGFAWIDIPFEIVDSDGRRLDSSRSMLPFGDKAANAPAANDASAPNTPGSRLPPAALPAATTPDDHGAENAFPEAGPETVRLPRATAAGFTDLVGGRRYQAYTRTVLLTDAALDHTEIVDAEALLAGPQRTGGYREWRGLFTEDMNRLYQLRDLGALLPQWHPGAPAYLVKVYVLVSPSRAEMAVDNIDRPLRPVLPITVLVIAAVAWSAADQALRIVERMRAQVATISATALDQRLVVPDSDDQIARLATTFNDALDRLEHSVIRERQFVADAAHELRNPIGSIRAILELARDHPDRVDSAAAITETAHETRRLQRLAEDLLLLARLESRATTLQPVDLAALAAAQVADHGRTGTVRVTIQTPPAGTSEAHTVPGSERDLDRLLSNLLDNAERHAATQVTVVVAPDPNDPTYVLLTVTDDGPGVPPHDRERIFDRFTRLDEARTRDLGGTGLGLAIARGICRCHHGTLIATGNPTGGARFTARLPRTTPRE